MKRYLPFVIIAAVLVAALGAGMLMFRSTQPQPSTTPAPATSPVPTTDVATSKGVVTVEEFGDYQCPPCGSLHPVIKTLKGEYGDRIKLVFYHYPLTQVHQHALEAAHAAAAARLQGKFWEMHNLLYEDQSAWSEAGDFRSIAIIYARQIGLDVERFMRDMDSTKAKAIISADVQRANALGVNSTPTIFIDGRMVQNENLTLEKLRQEINQKLAEAGRS